MIYCQVNSIDFGFNINNTQKYAPPELFKKHICENIMYTCRNNLIIKSVHKKWRDIQNNVDTYHARSHKEAVANFGIKTDHTCLARYLN